MTPPIALSPYSTAPLLPRVISIRSIEVTGKGGEVHALQIDVVDPASVDQDQRIGGRERAEAADVDGGPSAVDAAKQAGQLHAGHLRDDFLHGLRGELPISSAVITDVDAPTMPLNCGTAGTLVVAAPPEGAAVGRRVGAALGTTRRELVS